MLIFNESDYMLPLIEGIGHYNKRYKGDCKKRDLRNINAKSNLNHHSTLLNLIHREHRLSKEKLRRKLLQRLQ